MSIVKKVPFDSLCLAAVAAEIKAIEGAKCQRVWQRDDSTIVLALYARSLERYLLLSADAQFARIHFLNRKPVQSPNLLPFGQLVRANVSGSRLAAVRQVGFDRILHLEFETAEGTIDLIGEFMGKHSNLILTSAGKRILACAKAVGPSKSSRPVTIGRTYQPPPLPQRKSIFKATSWDEMKGSEGASPFLVLYLEAISRGDFTEAKVALDEFKGRIADGRFAPSESPSLGAYPLDLSVLGLSARPIDSLSEGLERHFSQLAESSAIEQRRAGLLSQLERVVLARRAAIHDLDQALDTAARAASIQMQGDLILAYQSQINSGDTEIETTDFEGTLVHIPLRSDLTPAENAQRYFDKAKKAKQHRPVVADQLARMKLDLVDLLRTIESIQSASSAERLGEIREEAAKRHWLHVQRPPSTKETKSQDPFQGHRIRSLLGPQGFTVLYGENATSNDFLTLRIAKPNDWWLHVRGDVSAHVVIQSHNQPLKVPHETIRFAAEIAVRNSSQKHSSYVPVDYTLKKYVRKPKGAPVGTALYTHEKTLHVDLKP